MILLIAGLQTTGQVTITARMDTLKGRDGYAIKAYELVRSKDRKPARHPKAVVFYIQGSEEETVLSKIPLLAEAVAYGGRVFLSDKRGCGYEGCDVREFVLYDNKQTRIDDHEIVVTHFTRDIDSRVPVIIIGSSEGGDIACVLAQRIPRITHLILLGSGGGFSAITELKLLVRKYPGYLGLDDTGAVDSVVRVIDTSNTDSLEWAGHSYKRWRSYWNDSSIAHIKDLTIPVLMVHGSADRNVPVESARKIDSVFSAKEKKNLTYFELADLDHRFQRPGTGENCFPYVQIAIIEWLRDRRLVSRFAAGLIIKRIKRVNKKIFLHH